MTELEIIPIRSEHLPELERKINEYNKEKEDSAKLAIQTHLRAARKALDNPNILFLLALEKETGQIVGYSYAEILAKVQHKAIDHWTVNLAKKESAKRVAGIGTELFKRKIAILAERRVSEIHGKAKNAGIKLLLEKIAREIGLKAEWPEQSDDTKFVLRVNRK